MSRKRTSSRSSKSLLTTATNMIQRFGMPFKCGYLHPVSNKVIFMFDSSKKLLLMLPRFWKRLSVFYIKVTKQENLSILWLIKFFLKLHLKILLKSNRIFLSQSSNWSVNGRSLTMILLDHYLDLVCEMRQI